MGTAIGTRAGLVLVSLSSLAWLWPRTGARAILLPPYFITSPAQLPRASSEKPSSRA